jgi:hypothetical protein
MDLRGRDRILVYNRDRSIEFEGDTPREFLPFFKEHGPKFFAKSSINPDGKIGLDDVVPMEDW